MYKENYIFYPHRQAKETAVCVKAEDLYTRERGYGFITEQNMEQDKDLMLPELNGGFMPVPWYHMLEIPAIKQGKYGCFIPASNEPSGCLQTFGGCREGQYPAALQRCKLDAPLLAEGVLTSRDGRLSGNGEEAGRQIPLRFKCKVPSEGSYRIKVTIRPEEEMSDIRVFTGRRCLALWQDKLSGGEALCGEMFIEVCGIIPRGQELVYEERCIEVTVTADRPCLSEIAIERVECPVLYIAGDSTVADQSAEYPYAPQTSYAGWGQMMAYFIQGQMPVSNHAHSGLTTESFREEGHEAIPMSRAKAGDFMLFQFGHNDQKLMHLKAREGYLANLERYAGECREKGVYPLFVTPVARNSWRGNDGAYNDLLKEYADACLELGSRLSVPVLDLHRLSMEFVLDLQKEGAKKYFYPSDYTHHNDFGAQRMAAMVCQEIKRTCSKWAPDDAGKTDNEKNTEKDKTAENIENTGYRWLAMQLKAEPVLWSEPVCMEPLKRPEGFTSGDAPEEFEEPDRPSDLLLRAEALDMVIRRAGFFNTNVYNDFFTDIVGHEWYAGAVECGLQNGIVTEDMCRDGKFRPMEPVTRLDFIRFLMMAYGSRKTLPQMQSCPYDAANEADKRILSAAYQLGILSQDGTDELEGCISRHEGAGICRNLKIM